MATNVPTYTAPARNVGDSGFTGDVNAARQQVAALTAFVSGLSSLQPVYATAILGQSNASGLAPQSKARAGLKQAFAQCLIWNNDTNQCEPLQMGVNEAGLNGAQLANLGAPGYEDGFGLEESYAEAHTAAHPDGAKRYLYKLNVEHLQSTQSSTLAYWQSTLFPSALTEIANMRAWLLTQGKLLVIDTLIWNQGEAEDSNGSVSASFKADTQALMKRFEQQVLAPTHQKIYIATQGPNYNGVIYPVQQQVADADPFGKFFKLASPTYLSDNVHMDADSQDRSGTGVYQLQFSKQAASTTTTTTPPATTTTTTTTGTAAAYQNLSAAGITKNGTVYSRSGTGGWGAAALAAGKLPASTVGGVVVDITGDSDVAATFGLDRSGAVKGLQAMDFCVYRDEGNHQATLFSGQSGKLESVVLNTGDKVRIWRAANGNITLDYSSDGGSTWQNIDGYGNSQEGMYHCIDLKGGGQLSNPTLYGFVS